MGELLIEVQDLPPGELGGKKLPRVQRFEDYAEAISTAMDTVVEQFRQSLANLQARVGGWDAEEVQVQFGLVVEATGNILLVQGSAAGNLTATITWRRE